MKDRRFPWGRLTVLSVLTGPVKRLANVRGITRSHESRRNVTNEPTSQHGPSPVDTRPQWPSRCGRGPEGRFWPSEKGRISAYLKTPRVHCPSRLPLPTPPHGDLTGQIAAIRAARYARSCYLGAVR
jgi:hypothetical protein